MYNEQASDNNAMLHDIWLQLVSTAYFVGVQVAMKLTEAQEQDLLHLRRLFYGKLGQLARERAALLQQMPSPAQPNEAVSFHRGFRNVADQLAQTKEVSDQLCANHAAESSVYQIHGFCMFRCVSLPLTAPVFASYPGMAGLVDLLCCCLGFSYDTRCSI